MNLGVSHARRSVAYQSIDEIIYSKNSTVIGKFPCKGYDTYGLFKLVGGIAKGHLPCLLKKCENAICRRLSK